MVADDRYHSNTQLLEEIERCADRAGERALLEAAGRTVQGRDIPVLRVAAAGRTPSWERPQAMVAANIHGTEVISSEVALRLAQLLTAAELGEGIGELLELADVAVLPAINLDARKKSAGALSEGRVLARAPRGNAHGVDMNRNFPFPRQVQDVWHPLAGTKHRWLPWYRGSEPGSEAEVRTLCALAERMKPLAAVNLHSVGRLFLYPWCCQPEAPADLEAFEAMGRAFVAAQPGRKYAVKQSRTWYTILGDMDDWLYDRFGTLSVTVELSAPLAGALGRPARFFSTLGWMNPTTPGPTVRNTAWACLAALLEGARCRSGS